MQNYGIDSWIDGKYKVRAELGSGGMASVKLAFDPDLNRLVAVKLLHQWGTDSQSFQRFEREAKVLSGLTHKNIVQVYKLGLVDGKFPYLLMEYVKGESLREFIARSRNLSCNLAVGIGMQICDALEFAHKHQIIHRDLKPENVMVCENGALVKVLDFGLCKIAPSDGAVSGETITETGTLLGSAHYMSPELCMGQKCDLRTDVYSFGSVLFEMITGSVPFLAENPADVFFMQVNKPAPKILELSPDSKLPVELQELILKCMQKDPEKRYQNFAELKGDLAAIVEMKSTAKFIPGKPMLESKLRKYRGIAAGFLVSSILLLFVACAIIFGTDSGNAALAVRIQSTFSADRATEILSEGVANLLKWKRTSAAKAVVESSLKSQVYGTWPLRKRQELLKNYLSEFKDVGDQDFAFNLSLNLLGTMLDWLRKSISDKSSFRQAETEMLRDLSKQLFQTTKSKKQWWAISNTIERHNPFKNKVVSTPHAWLVVLRSESLLHQENKMFEGQLHELVSACQSAAESLQLSQIEEEKNTLSLHYANEALRVCLRCGFLEQEAQVRIFRGTQFLRLGDIKGARKECRLAMAVAEQVPLSPSYAKFLEALKVGSNAGDYQKYLQYKEEQPERRPPRRDLSGTFLPDPN